MYHYRSVVFLFIFPALSVSILGPWGPEVDSPGTTSPCRNSRHRREARAFNSPRYSSSSLLGTQFTNSHCNYLQDINNHYYKKIFMWSKMRYYAHLNSEGKKRMLCSSLNVCFSWKCKNLAAKWLLSNIITCLPLEWEDGFPTWSFPTWNICMVFIMVWLFYLTILNNSTLNFSIPSWDLRIKQVFFEIEKTPR